MPNPITTGVFAKVTSGEAAFPIAVPTCTVLAVSDQDRFKVGVIEQQVEKHGGRMTLVGGKLTGNITPEQCADEEFFEEAGGGDAKITRKVLWTTKTDRLADVRVVTLKKATDGLCPAHLADTKVLAMYGVPDFIFIATVTGEMAPKDGEARRCLWLDVRDVRITRDPAHSKFGAQHDLLIAAYRRFLEGTEVDAADLADLVAFRSKLLVEQGDEPLTADEVARLRG